MLHGLIYLPEKHTNYVKENIGSKNYDTIINEIISEY